jgi:threonine dehydratase
MIPLEEICGAQVRLRELVHRTPMIKSAFLSKRLGTNVYLKLECLQKTGSFKPRGAFNKMLSLSPEERRRGIVAVSGGNHAQGAAYAARHLGVAATIVMPAGTPANYLDATRDYGAEIILVPDIRKAFVEIERLEREGLALVHPFGDPLVIAGQGTIGLEILEDVPDVTHVYVSIGGGGLISGIASALRGIRPEIHVIGVETIGADVMSRSLKENRLVELPAITSIARTLGAPQACELTVAIVRELVEEIIVVDDAATLDALTLILERTKYLVEPAASCCLVAAQRQRQRFGPDDRVVLVLCGGNVALADLCQWRQKFSAGEHATAKTGA